jgi:hypothetical protein
MTKNEQQDIGQGYANILNNGRNNIFFFCGISVGTQGFVLGK